MLALGFYTSAFVCEAVRSGINTVPLGQAEAARSLGMTFVQTLRLVVLPQATRTVMPPLSSIFIALTKNSAIAGAFSNTELFSVQKVLSDKGFDDRGHLPLDRPRLPRHHLHHQRSLPAAGEPAGGGPMSASVLYDAPGPKARVAQPRLLRRRLPRRCSG